MNRPDLHWLAGLLEGEGCFFYQCSPGIRIGMTDRDVVQRVADLFGRHVRGPYQYKANRKPVFYTEIWAAGAVALMQSLQPLMGSRRSAKIRDILSRWRRAPGKGHKLGTGRKPSCHLTSRHYALGLCRSCYRENRYKKGLSR